MTDEFAAPGPGLDISVRDYLDLVRRRRAIIIQALIAVIAGGFALTLTQKPSYRSSTRIMLEGKSFSIGQYDANNPVSGLFTQDNGHDIATQIEVIQGQQVLSDAFVDAGIPQGSAAVAVATVANTDLIDIIVESSVPQHAEQLAKALPKTYLRFVNGNHRSELASALTFAKARLDEENQRLLSQQIELRKVRQHRLVYSVADDHKARTAAAAMAFADFEKAQTSVASIETLLAGLIAERRSQPAIIVTATSTPNPDMAPVKSSLAALQAQRDALTVLFKPNSPRVEIIDAQIDALRKRLATMPAEFTSVTRKPNDALPMLDHKIAAVKIDLNSRKVTLRSLQARAVHAQQAMLGFDADEITQEQLESAVDNTKGKVAMFAKTVEDLNLRTKATHDPVMIVSPATRAEKIGARKPQTLLFAAVAGLIVGLCLALVQEYMDDRVNTSEDLRDLLPVPTLGFVPLIESEQSRILSPESDGSILECYRVLRSNVRFATVDTPSSSLLISSAVPGEGKSVTSVNLAIALAMDGVRVILVDLDLRRPTIHKKLGLNQSPGVTNVLVGHTALGDALQETDIAGLSVLTSGPLPPNPAELLNSKAMQNLHLELKNWADVVVIDAPPFLATADSQVLSATVDGMIFIVHLGVVKKPALRHVRDLLNQSKGKLLGVVFNKIDLSEKRDDYYYGYYRYYSEYHDDGQVKRLRKSTSEFDNLLVEVQSKEFAITTAATNGNGAHGGAEDAPTPPGSHE